MADLENEDQPGADQPAARSALRRLSHWIRARTDRLDLLKVAAVSEIATPWVTMAFELIRRR
jgi:hypothetical protein